MPGLLSRQLRPPVLDTDRPLDGLDNFDNQLAQDLVLRLIRRYSLRRGQEYVNDVLNESMVGGGGQVIENLVNHVRYDIAHCAFQGFLDGRAHDREVFSLDSSRFWLMA